ncbi:GAF and ANTAR domain-containing protein [Arthrobacter agilis]|uniref:GAF and ANTAR domain-containing protein n=1 Tax=Arthrobacter agilis TaxID=37921 RepID=UPI00236705D1|nr:GAF and ANTAR domain-containing protein [Arthrobacter agilis]WDF33210.1 GAF and ANTAR domain-containing protein [Arthrobacter agilis]
MDTHPRAPANESATESADASASRTVPDPDSTRDASVVATATPDGGPNTVDRAVAAAAVAQTLVLDSEAVHNLLDRLAHLIAEELSTAARTVLCGITLIRARTTITVASNSAHAKAMDEVQYSFGDGPCLDAARNQRTNYVQDVANTTEKDGRWLEFRAVIAEHGLHSVLAVPIPLDPAGPSRCAINLYADRAHAFSAADIETTQHLAREAADTVRIAAHIAQLTDTAQDLRAAMASRTTIDLAAGIIMAQNRCSQEAAVTILKAASSARNIKLRDLATAVIASISAENPTTHFDTSSATGSPHQQPAQAPRAP